MMKSSYRLEAVLLAIINDPAQIWARRGSHQNHGLEMTSIPAVNGACRSFTELRTRSWNSEFTVSQADVRTTGQSYFDGPPTNSATSIPKLSWSTFSPGYAGFSP
ncbi:hypothetical protein ACOSQ3_025903 [Xanthoceras sorbifolium]